MKKNMLQIKINCLTLKGLLKNRISKNELDVLEKINKQWFKE